MSDVDEYYFERRLPGFTYYSKRISSIFGREVEPRRFFYRVIEGVGGVVAVKEKSGIVLREGKGGRYQLKATVYENDGWIGSLTLQKWNSKGGPHHEIAFPLAGAEVRELVEFAQTVSTLHVADDNGGRLPDAAVVRTTLDRRQVAQLLEQQDVVEAVLKTDIKLQDVYGLARRRRELEYFRLMLEDQSFREAEEAKGGGAETVWQKFFEANTWIFGYGLSYVALSTLDSRDLKNRVSGYNLTGRGKEADALLKTQAAINSLCFIEIKGAREGLVREYRPGVFAPSAELAGATSQLQVNVQRALETLTEEFRPADPVTGDPTGERLFQFQPRSFLVIGSLTELSSPTGPNKDKFRSFELFRRSLRWPEIITYDELYARAKFIVGDDEASQDGADPQSDARDYDF